MFNENDFIILLTLSLAGDYAFRQSRHFRLTNKYSVVNNLRASSTMFNENDFIILLTLSLAGDYAFPRPTFYIAFVG